MDDSTRKQLQQIKADLDAGLIDEDQAKLLRDRALRLTLLQAPPSGAGNRNGTAAQRPATPRAATPAGPRAPAITPMQQAYLPAMNTRLLQFCVALWEGRLKLFGYKMQSAAASETFGELVQRMLLPLGKAHLINRPLKILSYQTQSERVSTQVGFDLLDEVGGLKVANDFFVTIMFRGRETPASQEPIQMLSLATLSGRGVPDKFMEPPRINGLFIKPACAALEVVHHTAGGAYGRTVAVVLSAGCCGLFCLLGGTAAHAPDHGQSIYTQSEPNSGVL